MFCHCVRYLSIQTSLSLFFFQFVSGISTSMILYFPPFRFRNFPTIHTIESQIAIRRRFSSQILPQEAYLSKICFYAGRRVASQNEDEGSERASGTGQNGFLVGIWSMVGGIWTIFPGSLYTDLPKNVNLAVSSVEFQNASYNRDELGFLTGTG